MHQDIYVEHGPCKTMKTWAISWGDVQWKENKKYSKYALEIGTEQWWIKGVN